MLSGKFVALIIVCNFSKIVKDKGRNNRYVGYETKTGYFFLFGIMQSAVRGVTLCYIAC